VSPPAAGIYLHVPFCSAVCPYCDFAVTVGGARSRSAYLDALLAEIALWGAAGCGPLAPAPPAGWRFDTVYLGGGTPSALAPGELAAALAAVRRELPVEPEAHLAMEANPEDASPEACAAWRRLGVATLSLGVQSFDPAALAFLGRRHRPAEARAAVEHARAVGFATVSLDLIFGLPDQTAAAWRRDLETAVALAPDHVSCYQLEVHAATPFGRRRARGELAEMPEPAQAELFALTHDLLAGAGYAAYEVSNFAAAPEHRSRHNRKYWDGSPYLGLGPSAHSFDGDRRRWWNERRLAPWRRRLERGEKPIAGAETLTPAERALETLMLGLRTTSGVDLGALARRTGLDLTAADRDRIARLETAGLVTYDGSRLAPTAAGLAVADALAAGFELDRLIG
jgi:oxygen-independent coproporphyrinogen-3 oxidase